MRRLNVLLLPVLSTRLSGELIRTALETVKGDDVEQWVQENLGDSTLAKIHRVLLPPGPAPARLSPLPHSTRIGHETEPLSG